MAHKERVAHIIWAAHILFYITSSRSHAKISQHSADTEEFEDCETDYETEKAVVMAGPRESVCRKFLDSIAQLLSPSKGWAGVTATALREWESYIEVDIARNDCFLINMNVPDYEVTRYCRSLEQYLFTSAHGKGLYMILSPNILRPFDILNPYWCIIDAGSPAVLATEFERNSIQYTHRRVDYWIAKVRTFWKTHRSHCNRGEQRLPGAQLAGGPWTKMTDFIRQLDDVDIGEVRVSIVQQAYRCIISTELQTWLQDAFGTTASSKLWNSLRFVARPLIDCRLLRSIATREPHFQNVRTSLVSPKPKIGVHPEYRVSISAAWSQLGFAQVSDFETKMIIPFRDNFKEACLDSFCLHAEMQLISHYEADALIPTIDYFGCSKKTCLLCETFLGALPRPISTRGRHGICYPAWGLPDSRSSTMKNAMRTLEGQLLLRIRSILKGFMEGDKISFPEPTPQSSVVSDFSRLTLDAWLNMEENLKLSRHQEETRRHEFLTSAGLDLPPRPTGHSLELFEPQDSCVMCNLKPARRCSQCQSSYYCSRECQKSDFPSHKLLCKQFSTKPLRPSTEHKLAIFFAVEPVKPQLIWVPPKRKTDGDGATWTEIDLYPYLGTDSPIKGTLRVEHNPVRNRNLGSGFAFWASSQMGYCVSLVHRDAYLLDGSISNGSISISVGSSGTLPHHYRGPMVAVHQLPRESYGDITLADFRHLIDYLVSYRSTQVRESDLIHDIRAPLMIRGVKICCYGEVKLHGTDEFVSVDFTRATRIALGNGNISPISSCLGMPLKLWKDPGCEFWLDPPGWPTGDMTPDSNPNAAFLMMETCPSKPEWGWAPDYWNRDIGNVLVLRENGEDLNVQDLKMICHFARFILQPMFGDTLEASPTSQERQQVLDFINWENVIKHSGNGNRVA
ncbi:hypothetical protein N7474_008688 [Penicillium riverlandense]|uniref:uncharacterized protein n=1 Tax=Penicillium riverlandense TaxID=1903569 RepID=UPI002546FB9E|nr:uncharacterized protein N7474_008688 [Penicillium riverlandense]KAJ5812387.1 hypothetical protein N7474_008688 [Penicillium riverlandense]